MEISADEKCDIVIPVWDNLELTRDCVDSIKKHTEYPYRVIIIDNASDAPTREYLNFLEMRNEGVVSLIRNNENKGFVRAVNQGMQFSKAVYMCIMNNDTISTRGWLSEMIGVLKKHSDIGIINPSSNSSGQFPGASGVDAYAKALEKYKGQYQELYTCRAFAMAVKREVIDKIGYLDDAYGMGYFDDTDYCKRAQQAGYKTVRSKASYVYHREGQSFARIEQKSNIFLENEKKFISKWGRRLRIAYIMAEIKNQKEAERASYSINNIARLGHQVWVFCRRGARPAGLNLIDHDNIIFFYLPGIFFNCITAYKIWKRKKRRSCTPS